MTTTTATPVRVIRSSVPGERVLHALNPFVSAILRSPLHRLLSGRVLLLTFAGRATDRQFTIPVGYTRVGETLTLFSSRSWWKNLGGGARVTVRLQGIRRTAHAEVIDDRAAKVEAAERLVTRYGLKGAVSRIGLALDTSPPPTADELAAALGHYAVIRLKLDP